MSTWWEESVYKNPEIYLKVVDRNIGDKVEDKQQKRKELLLKQAKHEIKIKADTFLKSADISLIGDAHLGQWDIDYIGNKSVQNIAFTSITTEQYFDLILSNPPFGTKKGGERATRDDLVFSSSNKQLNFLEIIYRSLNLTGRARAGVVLPDNVLFEDLDEERAHKIIEIAKEIETYEKSIEPYEDSCVIFAPKHPVTNPKLEDVLEEEAKIENYDEIMNEIFEEREYFNFG